MLSVLDHLLSIKQSYHYCLKFSNFVWLVNCHSKYESILDSLCLSTQHECPRMPTNVIMLFNSILNDEIKKKKSLNHFLFFQIQDPRHGVQHGSLRDRQTSRTRSRYIIIFTGVSIRRHSNNMCLTCHISKAMIQNMYLVNIHFQLFRNHQFHVQKSLGEIIPCVTK